MKSFFRIILFFFCITLSQKAFADGEKNDPPPTEKKEDSPRSPRAIIAENTRLKREIEELKAGRKKDGGGSGDDDGDDPLVGKARKDIEDKKRKADENKELESAVRFNLTVNDFIKDNKSLLPEEIDGILSHAAKERYDSDSERASSLKSAILSSYFAVEANMNSLTASQKNQVEAWKGLTKKDRENRSKDIYANIFEPAIETARKIKKAEEVARGRSGLANRSASQDNYQQRLIDASKKKHLKVEKS